MGVIIKGSIAEEYALHKQIEELMNGTDIPRNITNLGYLLSSKGIVKNPNTLYSDIKDEIIRAIIELRKTKGSSK